LTFSLIVSDADGDALTNSSNNNKGSFNENTGEFTWTPGYGDSGDYSWFFNTSDGHGGNISQLVTVTVTNVPLTITSFLPANNPTTTIGTDQTFSITLNWMADVEWYINGLSVESDPSTTVAYYTNTLAGVGVHSVTAIASDGNDTVSKQWDWTVEVDTIPTYIPPAPINLDNTSGNFWVNHNWEEGTGANITDGYNVSVNGEWHYTSNTYYYDTNLDPHDWSNITVYAYNASGGGTMNSASITANVQVANNVPVQTNIPDKTVAEGGLLTFSLIVSDADGDALTNSSNNNKGSFNENTGEFTWTPGYGDSGDYSWFFNTSDGHGGNISQLVTVTVTNVPLTITSFLPANNPTTTIGTDQTFSITLNWMADVEWYINGLSVESDPSTTVAYYTNTLAGVGVHSVTAIASDGNDTVSKQWDWTVEVDTIPTYIPPAPIKLDNTSGNFWVNHNWKEGTGANITDGYNVNLNGEWHYTYNTYYYDTSVGPHDWSNITVYAYNASGGGTMNSVSITANVQVANNDPVQTNIADQTVAEGEILTFSLTVTDADGDALTNSSNNTKGSFNENTGEFTWTPGYGDSGVYSWFFNTSDGHGGNVSQLVIVTVTNVPLTITSFLPANNPTTTIGTDQTFSITLNWMADVEWYINGSSVESDSSTTEAYYTNTLAGVGVHNVSAIVSDGNDTVSKKWDWTVEVDATPPSIFNVINGPASNNSVIIFWDTDEISDSLVKYGINTANLNNEINDSALVINHYIVLTGLMNDTKYYYVVNSTDSIGNSNQSKTKTFTTTDINDITPPIINDKYLSKTSNVKSGETLTVTINVTDNIGVTSVNANNNINLTRLNATHWNGTVTADLTKKVDIIAYDAAGNTNTTTLTYSLYTSGSSGGGGGGTSGEAFANIVCTETDRQFVGKDLNVKYNFKLKGNYVQHIQFTGLTGAGKVAAKVEILNHTSTIVKKDAPNIVFKNLNVWIGNMGYFSNNNIKDPTITFIVDRSWVRDNDIILNTISFYSYNDRTTIWEKMSTQKIGEDSTSYLFKASLPIGGSLGPMAISGREVIIIPTSEPTADPGGLGMITTPTQSNTEQNSPEITPTTTPVTWTGTWMAKVPGFQLLAALIPLITLYFISRRRD